MNGALNPNDDSKNYNVLVVDDDPATRRMVTSYFEEHDVSASSAAGRQDLTRHLAVSEPSLIILDLRLGREDGLDLLREIRSNSDVPVIITTGHRLEEIDRVVGLELGADDYVTKPFGLRELLARVRAVLRRHELGGLARAREPQRGGYKFGGWPGCTKIYSIEASTCRCCGCGANWNPMRARRKSYARSGASAMSSHCR